MVHVTGLFVLDSLWLNALECTLTVVDARLTAIPAGSLPTPAPCLRAVQPQRLLFQQARDNLLGRRSDVYCDLALRLRPWSEEEEL